MLYSFFTTTVEKR